MTGLEKITEKISADTSARCAEIIASAEASAETITAQAKKDAEAGKSAIIEKAKAEAESIISMAESGAAQKSRQAALAAKVNAVNSILAGVLNRLKSLPRDEYFGMVIAQAKANAMPGACTAKLCKSDYERMPQDFADKLTAALSGKGAECSLSDESANIESGLVLIYGDIEINCSFEAIAEEKADELKSEISRLLF